MGSEAFLIPNDDKMPSMLKGWGDNENFLESIPLWFVREGSGLVKNRLKVERDLWG